MTEGREQQAGWRPLRPGDPRDVAGYRLRARLGSGGMGDVYLSYTRGGQPVAVKLVRAELAEDAEFRRRFDQEVTAARRVQGLYTVPVLDSDTTGPVPWLATAYVPAPSLTDSDVRHGPLPRSSVLLLTAGVAEALQAIHSAGVVHRDLKPSNVLLASDGPRVIDFGIARAADATSLTDSGMRIGTPGFMSPEQAQGTSATPAADFFSLGLVAHYAATGTNPFGEGPAPALLYRIVSEPPDLSQCPDGLRELVARCLAKNPSERPEAAEVIETCRRLSGDTSLRREENWLPQPLVAEITSRTAQHPAPLPPPDPAMTPPARGTRAGDRPTGRPTDRPASPVKARTAVTALLVAAALLLGVLGGRALTRGSDDDGAQAGQTPAPSPREEQGQPREDPPTLPEEVPPPSATPTSERAPTPTPTDSEPLPGPSYVLSETNVSLIVPPPRYVGTCSRGRWTRVDFDALVVDATGSLEQASLTYQNCYPHDGVALVVRSGVSLGTIDADDPTAEECRAASRRNALPGSISKDQVRQDSLIATGTRLCATTPAGAVVLLRVDEAEPIPETNNLRTYHITATQWLPADHADD